MKEWNFILKKCRYNMGLKSIVCDSRLLFADILQTYVYNLNWTWKIGFFKILFEDGSFALHCRIYYWSFSHSLLFKMKWRMNIGKWNEKNPNWCSIKYNQVFLLTIQYILICHFSNINNDLVFFFSCIANSIIEIGKHYVKIQ